MALIIVSDTFVVVSHFKGISYLSLRIALEEMRTGIFIPVSHMRKLRLSEVKQFLSGLPTHSLRLIP